MHSGAPNNSPACHQGSAKNLHKEIIRHVPTVTEEVEEVIQEVPQIQTVERVVEIPQTQVEAVDVHVPKIVTQEVLREVPVVQTHVQERLIEVPKIQTVERVVPVPQVQTVERVVPVPQTHYHQLTNFKPVATAVAQPPSTAVAPITSMCQLIGH